MISILSKKGKYEIFTLRGKTGPAKCSPAYCGRTEFTSGIASGMSIAEIGLIGLKQTGAVK